MIELSDGRLVPVSSISIGDVVRVGPSAFSPVFIFTHKVSSLQSEFVSLETVGGAYVRLTEGHYIYANGALVAAGLVRAGDALVTRDGGEDVVVRVRRVTGVGLFNPQTVHGDIVVDGVLVSTYTMAVEPGFAHAMLAPLRALHVWFGFVTAVLESGGGAFKDLARGGEALY
jgi:Hint module